MNTDQINKLRELLDRYYAAEITTDEERCLLRLLSDPGLPEEFRPDRKMIGTMTALSPSDDFEIRLSAKIDALSSKENNRTRKTANLRRSNILQWCVTAAAVLLIAVATLTRISSPAPQPTPLTPEETYEQATMALMVFSDALNKGYAAIEQADATTVDATEKAVNALATVGIYLSEKQMNMIYPSPTE